MHVPRTARSRWLIGEIAVGSGIKLKRRPRNQVLRSGGVGRSFTPVHDVAIIQPGRHKSPVVDLGDDRSALRPASLVGRAGERWTMLAPNPQIVRAGNSEATLRAVKRRVDADISAIWGFDDAGILTPTRPFCRLPPVAVREQDRLWFGREGDAVVTDRQTDARSAAVGPD